MTAPAPPVLAPDAFRVWRGFRAPAMTVPAFFERLSKVFVPATVLMQIDAGLDAYVPTVLAGLPDKPDEVPDETAILLWDSQKTYADGFNKLAVRTYTLTHGAVYTPMSGAAFPVPFGGSLQADQPYHLTDRGADWMHGTVRHLIGGRPADVDSDSFKASIAEILTAAQQRDQPLGAIACAGEHYLVYWELEGAPPRSSAGRFSALAERTAWNHVAASQPVSLDAGLWDDWDGMNIEAGDSLNVQFRRRWER